MNTNKNKVLTLEQMKKMSQEEIISAYRNGYVLEGMEKAGCGGCGVQVAGIKALATTCTKTSAFVGETITLKAKGTGGTPPYTIDLFIGAVLLQRSTGIDANIEVSKSYTIQTSDVGILTANTTIIDSCPGGSKTCTELCPITVVECPVPTCSFTVI